MTLHVFMDALTQLRGAVRGATVRITEQEQTQTRTLLSSLTAQLSFPWCGKRLTWTVRRDQEHSVRDPSQTGAACVMSRLHSSIAAPARVRGLPAL